MHNNKALIIGSYIVYILNNMVPVADKSHGSVIRLKQSLLSVLRKQDKTKSADAINQADKVWQEVLEEFSGTYILPATMIEALYFNHEQDMIETFGSKISNLVIRYTEKHQNNNHARDSYNIADAMSARLNLKDIKWKN